MCVCVWVCVCSGGGGGGVLGGGWGGGGPGPPGGGVCSGGGGGVFVRECKCVREHASMCMEELVRAREWVREQGSNEARRALIVSPISYKTRAKSASTAAETCTQRHEW